MPDKQPKLDIKSPIFKPRPGWGGKLKIWFTNNFESKVLLAASVLVLIIGLYGVFNDKNNELVEIEDLESEVIERIAQPRQGLTHLARAVLLDFLNSKGIALSPAQNLFAETYLVTKLNNRLVHAGDTVIFKVNDLTETIEKAQTLTPHQLQRWQSYLR